MDTEYQYKMIISKIHLNTLLCLVLNEEKLNWPLEHIWFTYCTLQPHELQPDSSHTGALAGRRSFSHRTMNERAVHWNWQSPKPHRCRHRYV